MQFVGKSVKLSHTEENFSAKIIFLFECNSGRWWSGPWQHCSVSCGENGFHRRTVLCVRQSGPGEQIALEDGECEGLRKPPQIAHCKEREPCPVEESPWKIGPWSEVSRKFL